MEGKWIKTLATITVIAMAATGSVLAATEDSPAPADAFQAQAEPVGLEDAAPEEDLLTAAPELTTEPEDSACLGEQHAHGCAHAADAAAAADVSTEPEDGACLGEEHAHGCEHEADAVAAADVIPEEDSEESEEPGDVETEDENDAEVEIEDEPEADLEDEGDEELEAEDEDEPELEDEAEADE